MCGAPRASGRTTVWGAPRSRSSGRRLSDLHFAADAGKLKAQGARIIGARPYLSLRLAEGNDSIGGSR